MLNLILFGPPGAGKGTQSAKLVEKYQLTHLSTGDILRNEIAIGSILGQEAKILMDQGMLVPDEIVITMINNKIDKNIGGKGFIFDGFPRTVAQAQALDKLLIHKGLNINLMLALDVSTEELTKRILQRGLESGRVDDIDEKTIRNRVAEYTNKTAPLKNYYSGQQKAYTVSGIGSVDEIFNALCTKIDSIILPDVLNATGSFDGQIVSPKLMQKEPDIVVQKVIPATVLKAEPENEKKKFEAVAEVENKIVDKELTVKKKLLKPTLVKVKKKIAVRKEAAKPVAKKKTAKPVVKKKTAKKKVSAKKKVVKPIAKKKAAKKKVTIRKNAVKPTAKKKAVKKKATKPVAKKVVKKKVVTKKKTNKKK